MDEWMNKQPTLELEDEYWDEWVNEGIYSLHFN